MNVLPRTLCEKGIAVTALHNHTLDDEPRMRFMHFSANEDAAKLGRGLASALGQVAIAQN